MANAYDPVFDKDVYDYVITQSASFKTSKVPLGDGRWEWNLFDHVTKSTLYKNSKFYVAPNDGSQPFKNTTRPILNVAYRSEGFDVKDVEPFVDDPQNFYKSFIVRRYQPRWAREHEVDTFIDQTVESFVDYGLALSKRVPGRAPECVNLQTIAFCDQTDILKGPIGILHHMTPDQLVGPDAPSSWDKDECQRAIDCATAEVKQVSNSEQKAATPGKYVEVYEVHGVMPAKYLTRQEGDEWHGSKAYERQAHYVVLYVDQTGEKKGITLWKGKEAESPFDAIKRDDIFGRAAGMGGIEELFESQTWINYDELRLKEMLDAAAMTIIKTTDPAWRTRNNVEDLEAGVNVIELEEGKDMTMLDTQPRGVAYFENKVKEWEESARQIGSASEAALGVQPSSGTPFALQALITAEGQGTHEYRRGKLAVYLERLYRRWVLPDLVADIKKGHRWLDELSGDELESIADAVATNEYNARVKKGMLSGKDAKVPTPQEAVALRAAIRQSFVSGGGKRFIEAVEGELDDLPVDVAMNVAGKQKYLARNADKLTNIFRQVVANPQILKVKGMAKLFNEIVESSGFSPLDFADLTALDAQPAAPEAALPADPVAAGAA